MTWEHFLVNRVLKTELMTHVRTLAGEGGEDEKSL